MLCTVIFTGFDSSRNYTLLKVFWYATLFALECNEAMNFFFLYAAPVSICEHYIILLEKNSVDLTGASLILTLFLFFYG